MRETWFTRSAVATRQLPLLTVLFLLLLLCPRTGRANAFYIQEFSGRGLAQGGASIADASEASAIYFNPAALPYLPHDWNASVGVTTYFVTAEYEDPETGEVTPADDTPAPVPFAFVSYRPLPGLAFGVSASTRFGLPVKWPDRWAGDTLIREVKLESTCLAVAVAYDLFDIVSIGVSVDTTFGSVMLSRGLDLGLDYGVFRFGGTAVGVSASAALYARPLDWLAVGLTYHGPTRMALENVPADFDVPNRFAELFPDQKTSAEITLPDIAGIGVRVWPAESLSLELDVVLTVWSRFKELKFEFSEGIGSPKMNEQVEPKDWYDAVQVRLGADWETPVEDLHLRVGFIYDGLAVPTQRVDPMLPDNHRFDFGAGIGYSLWAVTVDVGYLLVYLLPREVDETDGNPFPAKYSGLSHVLTVGLTFAY